MALISLLLLKQSDQGLHCLFRLFGLATNVQNFRSLIFHKNEEMYRCTCNKLVTLVQSIRFSGRKKTCSFMGGSRGGRSGPPAPEKSQIYRLSLQYWSEYLEKSQSYQASICPPSKRHFNGVSLVGQWWPIYGGIWILYHPIN